MRCLNQAEAGVTVKYADREVIVLHLRTERDPAILDLCADHVARLVPPLGWRVEDLRETAVEATG